MKSFRLPGRMTNSTFPFFVNAAFNIPLSVLITVGNSLILVSFARTPSLLTPSNVLLIGLAISDLCIGLIAQPLYIAWKFEQHKNPTQTVPAEILENVFNFSSYLLSTVSFMIVSSLSVDRFLAVHLHLRYHGIITVKRVTSFVCFLWGCSVVASSLGIWRKGSFEKIAAPGACICFFINAVLYFDIYRVVRRHQLQISHQLTSCFATQPVNTTRSKNCFFDALYLYLIFLLCYIPYMYTAVRIIMDASNKMEAEIPANWLSFEVSGTIVYINSFLNPLFFSWRLKNIRAAVKRTLNEMLCKMMEVLWCSTSLST